MIELVPLQEKKEAREPSLFIFMYQGKAIRTHNEMVTIYKPGRGPLSRTESVSTLNLDILVSRIVTIFFFFKPPNLGRS